MGFLFTAAVIGGATLGGILGGSSAKKKVEAQKEQIRNAMVDVRENIEDTNLSWLDYNRDFGFNQQQNTFNQQLTARANAVSDTISYSNDVANLTGTIVEAKASVGAIVQRNAVSGFRNTGSYADQTRIARAGAERAVDRTQQAVTMSASQRFIRSRQTYLNADLQRERYNEMFDRQLGAYNTNITRLNDRLADLEEQLDKINSNSGWDIFAGAATGAATGAAIAATPFK